jgi:RHS repeat-associated protein
VAFRIGITNYVYDGANVVGEYSSTGTLLAKYTQGSGIDQPLSMSRGGATSYYSADGLGSVTSMEDGTGSAVAAYTYDAFGNITTSAGSITNPFRYTGREWDSETSLYYYRARYYEPERGRFLSEDPLRFVAGLNFYNYVAANPVRFVDPAGLDAKEFWNDIKNVGITNTWTAYQLAEQSLQQAAQWARDHGFPQSSMHNGSGDAFRHCLWSCLMAQQIGIANAQLIADEHERTGNRGKPPQPPAEEQMDQANNAVGRNCASKGNCYEGCTNAYTHALLYGLGGRRDYFPDSEPQ